MDKEMEKSIRKFVKWLHHNGYDIAKVGKWQEDTYTLTNDVTNNLIIEFLKTHHND